jgi:hypothetical protein
MGFVASWPKKATGDEQRGARGEQVGRELVGVGVVGAEPLGIDARPGQGRPEGCAGQREDRDDRRFRLVAPFGSGLRPRDEHAARGLCGGGLGALALLGRLVGCHRSPLASYRMRRQDAKGLHAISGGWSA